MSSALAALFESPLFAIFFGIGVMVFVIKLGESIHARASHHAPPPASSQVTDVQQQVGAVQAELRELRDTVTQHAMSLDRNVELLTQRLNQLEGRASASGEVHQRLGGGDG
jgi:uncharacterized coiled-coil protein SlyX